MASVGGKCAVLLLLYFYFITLESLVFAAAEPWNRTIYVSPQGNDSITCGDINFPCETVDQGLQNAFTKGASSTRVLLERGQYNLSTSFNFTNIENFAIYGEESAQAVTITCAENISIAFTLVKDLLLKGFTLRKCGGWHVSSVSKTYWKVANPKFITAVYINYCYGLQVLNVKIAETPGVGLNAYTVSGKVVILNSIFDHNVPTDKNQTAQNQYSDYQEILVEPSGRYAKAGGGVFLSVGVMKHNPLQIPKELATEYTKPTDILIQNCNFTNNVAPTPNFKMSDIPDLPFSRGGGLALLLVGNSTNNYIVINSNVFANNVAVWGGGMQIELQSRTQNNTVKVTNTVFENNLARAEGGGFRLSSTVEQDLLILPNVFNFISCQITNNSALWGGGLTTYGATFLAPLNALSPFKQTEITFRSCNISRNSGTVGSAIGAFLVNRNEDDIGPGVPYRIIFEHCKISHNKVTNFLNFKSYVVGQGAIYTDEVPLIFKKNVIISYNNGTAVVLDSAVMDVHNNMVFENNKGFRGGALSLYGNSRIVLAKYSKLSFLNNFCEEKGGAMYVEAPGPPLVSFNANGAQIHKCFLAYEEDIIDYNAWETEIVFQNNSVGDKSFKENSSGKSVFASTLRDCLSVGETRGHNTALEWKFIKYLDEGGRNVSFKGQAVTEPIDIILKPSEWNVAPSQVFNATVTLIDEKGNNVYGIVQILISSDPPSVHLKGSSELFLVYDKITGLAIKGSPGEKYNVGVKTTGKHLVHKVLGNLTVQQCFPGYYFQDNDCVCASNHQRGIYNCSDDGRTVFIRDGYWAGIVDSKLLTNICPDTYCRANALSNGQEQAYKYEPEKMCIESRQSDGILCGACKANYTVQLGTEECSSECSNLHLLTVIPYGIALFLMVMIVTLINLDVFTGYLNAWLYSFQVMYLLFIEGFNLDYFMQFMIGLANIQIKLSGGSCFMKKMDDADKLVIMYILPVYIFISVYVLAKVVRKYPNWCYSRRVKAPFRALCTLFVLCYTNITAITLKLLYPARIGDKTVLFMDGQVEFFKGKHIGYALIAIFFLIFIVIPCPLILMFTPFFTKMLRPVVNVFTLKPYYDAFQGCFKDEYRWCSAFYFVCRLYLIVIATYIDPSPLKRAILEDSCMIILAVFVYLKPYKQEYNWLNLLDAVLLSNLGIMAIFSTALQNAQSFGLSYIETLESLIRVLSYVPLCYLVCLLTFKAYKYREDLKAYMIMKMNLREDSFLKDACSDVEPQSLVADPESSDYAHQM